MFSHGNVVSAGKQTAACIPTVFGVAFSSHAVSPRPDLTGKRTQQAAKRWATVVNPRRIAWPEMSCQQHRRQEV